MTTTFKKDSNNQEGRDIALKTAISAIKKAHGSGAIMVLGEERQEFVETFPSGSIGLDIALGNGGFPKGRIIEIYGLESSGKTTIALQAVAEVQKRNGVAAFIDAEHAFDRSYASRIGVDVENLVVSQPDYGEQALEIVDTLTRSGSVDIIVVDSVAALVPKAEIEGEMGDQHMGLQARLMSQALRKLTGVISKSKCTLIFINQIRMKIGISFGNPETTTGGNALKFYSSIRLEVRKSESIKDKEEFVGNRVKVKVVKNKLSSPFRIAEFDIIYGEGISKVGELVDIGADMSIVEKAGTWYSYNGVKIGQGRENAKRYLKENSAVAEEITAKIMAATSQNQTVSLREVEEHADEANLSDLEG
ncbi:Protein RecA [Candidatus Fokinia solitaria]|uniref:Protein RecA n=1 Tax=Candidatus Fokinia solitaria TaxID=1802984 RepID=A0A2U8BS33_9RICK|nr:recombinase RecA [Candidatus Fokinia solitaria]AWD33152.1 Protein RecA [Candidatus Fokinia solitaria]